MEYKFVELSHLKARDFGVDHTSNDLVRGHCMWGGSDMATHDWCGVKVQNPMAGSGVIQRKQMGVKDGRLYGFAVFQGMDDGRQLRPETLMSGLWVCEDHDEAFKELHEDWKHTLVTFAAPMGNVYAVEPVTEQMFEVSFRYYTEADTDTNHVSLRWDDVINSVLEDTERTSYLKVVGT